MRVSLGSDRSCQSHVQTRAFVMGPFPLVGLADIRIFASWIGSGHVNLMLIVKWHGKIGHMVLSQATRSHTRGTCTRERMASVVLV